MDSQETNKNNNIDRNIGWDKASQTDLPNVSSASAGVWRKAQLQRRFSNTLRENAFMETQIQFLKKKNRLMSDKNVFLQDQFLLLKEQYHSLLIKQKQAQFTNTPITPPSHSIFNSLNVNTTNNKQITPLTTKQQKLTPTNDNKVTDNEVSTNKVTQTKQLSTALLSAGKVINKQRIALQAISKLIQAHKKHNWLFFKKQQKRQNMIQNLNAQLQNYLQQITRKSNIFNQWHKMFFKKQLLKQNKKITKTITNLTNEKNKVQQKYMQLKTKWEDRISSITQHKKYCFQKAIIQHKENKKQVITQFKNQIQDILHKKDKDIKSINIKHQELLSQKEIEYKKLLSENEKNYEQLLNTKTALIAELHHETAQLQQQKMSIEKHTQDNTAKQLKKEHDLLLKEKTTEWQQIKNRYEETLADMKNNREKEIQQLKTTYDKNFNKNQQALDERMIELKEEHDNQLHLLRTEMEHELLAERRKFIKAEKTYSSDIKKLQKDFRKLQSELELKKFNHKKQEIKEHELEGLRVLNTALTKENEKLKTLWEHQRPNMEKQQQQIICLQKLNAELSRTLQNKTLQDKTLQNKSVKKDNTHQQTKINQSESHISSTNIQSVFKDIHIHHSH